VRDQLLPLAEHGRLYLLLDFHSTFKDVFYIQPDDAPSSPAGFTRRWLDALERRLPEYPVKREASPVPTPTTSTYWAHHAFGIPAITYEIGDGTERALLQTVAKTAAEEMMKLLLELRDVE
jgi:cytosolic carboxypeptidase protein 6